MASALEEITAQLEKQLNEATTKIDEFIQQQNQQLQKAVNDHEHTIRELEAKISKLTHDEESAMHRAGNAHEVVAAESAQLADKAAEVARLEDAAKRLPVELDAARAAEAAAKAQLEVQQAEHDRRESEARFQLQELTRGVAFYRRLGLEFDKIHDDKLRMVFTQVDPADPARRFAFTVWVTPAETYALDDVAPALPPGVAPALLAELNAGNDFSAFVQRMRRAFKALVEGGQ